jgi:hypothetical protein
MLPRSSGAAFLPPTKAPSGTLMTAAHRFVDADPRFRRGCRPPRATLGRRAEAGGADTESSGSARVGARHPRRCRIERDQQGHGQVAEPGRRIRSGPGAGSRGSCGGASSQRQGFRRTGGCGHVVHPRAHSARTWRRMIGRGSGYRWRHETLDDEAFRSRCPGPFKRN